MPKQKKSSNLFYIYIVLAALVLTVLIIQTPAISRSITGFATQTVTVNVSISNTAPEIVRIFNETLAASITENSASNVIINFTAYDAEGASNLDTGGGRLNITYGGTEITRYNNTCRQVSTAGSYANYSCTIDVWYFDISGAWNIQASVNDSSNSRVINRTANITIAQTTALAVGPGAITFAAISPGGTNTTSSNDPLLLNNTGNKHIPTGGIDINVTRLVGETDNSKAIYSGNITISNSTGGSNPECDSNGTAGRTAAIMNITSGRYANVNASAVTANMSRGNHSVNTGSVGQEQLYVCITLAGSELTQQAYSTANQGAWTIQVT